MSDPTKLLGVEHLSAVIGAGAALALALSICYDTAYFLALGIRMDEIPTTLADHVRTSAVWAPMLIISVLAPMLGGIRFHMGTLLPPGHVASKTILQKTGGLYKLFFYPAFVALLCLVITGHALWGGIFVIFMWLSCVYFVSHRRSWNTTWPKLIALMALPSLVILMISVGAFAAQATAAGNSTRWTVKYKVDEKVEVVEAKGIRRLSSVFVVIDKSNRVHVHPESQILAVVRTKPLPTYVSLICLWFGWNCPS